jgi:ABC-type glutathione transport system ATPase component
MNDTPPRAPATPKASAAPSSRGQLNGSAPPGPHAGARVVTGESGLNLKPSGRVHAPLHIEEVSGETIGATTVADPIFSCRDVNVFYGSKHAIKNVGLDVGKRQVLAMIGPSGCG